MRRLRSFSLHQIFHFTLLLVLAAVFLFSGISKLTSVASLEWALLDMGVPQFTLAAFLARFLIGLELLLGVFLLGHVFLKSFTYPAVLLLLGLLSAYLVVLLVRQGNTGDCGCFGDWLSMRPGWALLKNAGMILATLLLWRTYALPPYRGQAWLALAAGMAAIVVPLVVAPVRVTHRLLDLSPLYAGKQPAPAVDLRRGKHVVAFLSLTCPHCKDAASTFRRLYRENPQLPVFLVLNGPPEQEQAFFEETGAQGVPHLLFRGIDDFVSMAGQYVPSIYYVHDSRIERQLSQHQLSRVSIEQWAGH